MTGSKPVRVKIGYRREVNRQSPFSPQEIWIVRKTGTDSERARRVESKRDAKIRDRRQELVSPHFRSRFLIKIGTDSIFWYNLSFRDRLHYLQSCNILLRSIRTDLPSAVTGSPSSD